MTQIQLTINLPGCRTNRDALDIAQAAAEHLRETFNDDSSLGAIFYRVRQHANQKASRAQSKTTATRKG